MLPLASPIRPLLRACHLPSWTQFLVIFAVLLCVPVCVCFGQPAADKPAAGSADTPQDTIESVQKRINALEKRINSARTAESDLNAHQLGVSLEKLAKRTHTLESIRSAHQRLLTAMKMRQTQAGEKALLQEKHQESTGTGVAENPPYNLSFYDNLLNALATIEQEKAAAFVARGLSERSKEALENRLHDVQQEWRRLNDKIEGQPETAEAQQSKYELLLVEFDQELLETLISYETVNQQNRAQQIELLQLEADIARRKIEWVTTHLHADETDLKNHVDAIRARQEYLALKLQETNSDLEKTDVLHLEAGKWLDAAVGDEAASLLQFKLRGIEAWREAYQTARELIEAEIQLLGEQERLWKTRYRVAEGGVTSADLSNLRSEVDGQLKELGKRADLEHRQLDAIRSRMANIKEEFKNQEVLAAARKDYESILSALRRMSEDRSEYLALLLADQQLKFRVMEETVAKTNDLDLEEKLQGWFERFEGIWGIEVWVIDNNAVTVREVIVALLVLVLGIILVKIVLRPIGRRIFAIANIKETNALTITKIVHYFAYVMVALLALRIVNIPIGAFAFLGGAIAIGLGFGAQNLINNFISGFIMMAERPVKIGDLIEVDGILGKVEDIGARCTRLRTGGNIQIMVPNSSFLENNITNWTLTDQKVRVSVAVGVAYGSSVNETRRQLLRSVKEDGDALETPEPFVLFVDFGDNTLNFEVHFWIRVTRPTERRIIQSNVRFRIDKLFNDAGLVIAFPQRDVHLDSEKPLQLHIVNPKESPSADETP